MGLGPFRPGDQCRGYEIVRELGEGGYSCVYEATREFSTIVKGVIQPRELAYALKCLKRCYADIESARDRLNQEAFLLVGLQHENIVRFIDTGFSETGFDFVVMELAEGKTLAERLTGWHFSVSDALKIAMQIADGLAWAHAKGVLHLDLKPRNVMITDDLGVKVLDLGAAKYEFGWHVSNTTPATAAQITVGYAAPEQLDGSGEVDHRADIFALGEITYEMLTGQHPFRGKATQRELCAARQLRCQAEPLSEFGIPEEVAAIIHRALARNPDDRHASMAELRDALRGAYYSRAEDVVERSPKPVKPIKQDKRKANGVVANRGPTVRVADPLAVFKNPTRPNLEASGVVIIQHSNAQAVEPTVFDRPAARRESTIHQASSIRLVSSVGEPVQGGMTASSTRARKLGWIMSLTAAMFLAVPFGWGLKDHWRAGAGDRWAAKAAAHHGSASAPTVSPEESLISPTSPRANLELVEPSAPKGNRAADPGIEGSVRKESGNRFSGGASTLKRKASMARFPKAPVDRADDATDPSELLDNPFKLDDPFKTEELNATRDQSAGELGVVPLPAVVETSTFERSSGEPPSKSKRKGPKWKAPTPAPNASQVPEWDTIGAEMGATREPDLNWRLGQ